MKDHFAFLFPPPRALRPGGGALDAGGIGFPLEILKKYDFLFDHFGVRGRGRGTQAVFQESRGLGGEEYVIECVPGRIVLAAATGRGQFYALSTLLQLLAFHAASGALPAFTLRDSPATAFRGAALFRSEAAAEPPALRRDFLRLALLKFNHLALPAGSGGERAAAALAPLARSCGMELLLLDGHPDALGRLGAAGGIPPAPLRFPGAGVPAEAGDEWLGFFLGHCRAAREEKATLTAWSDRFLRRPEWVRKIPRDVLIWNRGAEAGRSAPFVAAARPFREHHVRQVLCPSLCGPGRFLPDGRAAMARADAACAAAAASRLAGVLLDEGGGEEGGCLPQGAALARFQSGCRLWSGRASAPVAFGRWALGRDEPDLFRVYSFLAQAEGRLPHGHDRYLFEDPLLAPFSRQDDPRRVVAHYRKAAQYLDKRETPAGGMSGFLAFAARLYATVAAKVEFSSRLALLLEEGGEELQRRAAGLESALAGLLSLYVEAFTAPTPDVLREFAQLGAELARLGAAASSPGALAELRSRLENAGALEAEEAAPADRY